MVDQVEQERVRKLLSHSNRMNTVAWALAGVATIAFAQDQFALTLDFSFKSPAYASGLAIGLAILSKLDSIIAYKIWQYEVKNLQS